MGSHSFCQYWKEINFSATCHNTLDALDISCLLVYYYPHTLSSLAEGLSFPTSMDFVDNKNILVLEKNLGTIRLVSSSNNSLQEEPVLGTVVDSEAERGLLGIATLKDSIFFHSLWQRQRKEPIEEFQSFIPSILR
jgi:hypothetical protein